MATNAEDARVTYEELAELEKDFDTIELEIRKETTAAFSLQASVKSSRLTSALPQFANKSGSKRPSTPNGPN